MLAQHAVPHPMLEDVRFDLVRGYAPCVLALRIASNRGHLRGTVERNPAHQLRRHVMLRSPPRLPDPLVRLAPHRRGALSLGLHDRPQPPRETLAAARVQQNRVQDSAEYVVLALVEGAVANGPGVALAYPDRSSRVDSVRSRRPSIPYMIWRAPSS